MCFSIIPLSLGIYVCATLKQNAADIDHAFIGGDVKRCEFGAEDAVTFTRQKKTQLQHFN
jgi:hypothetical protein